MIINAITGGLENFSQVTSSYFVDVEKVESLEN